MGYWVVEVGYGVSSIGEFSLVPVRLFWFGRPGVVLGVCIEKRCFQVLG